MKPLRDIGPKSRSGASTQAARGAARGKTRWRQVAYLGVPAAVIFGALALGTLEGVVPARLALYDIDVRLSGTLSAPQGLQAYTGHTHLKNGTDRGALIATIPQADLPNGACLSLSSKLPILGRWTVQIHSGSKVQITDATLDASALLSSNLILNPTTTDGQAPASDGSNVRDPVALGKDSGDMPLTKGKPGEGFGLDVRGPVQGENLDASAHGAVIAGTLTLGVPTISLHSGTSGMNVCRVKTSASAQGGAN